eukprot:1337637-Pyramimonas_sp.AAC.1
MRLHHPLSECNATCGCTTLPDQPLSECTYICITVFGARAPTDISGRVLTLWAYRAGQWTPPRAVPPASAPRLPQLRLLSLALTMPS